MNVASPLRYPGGKAVMAGLLAQIRKINGLGNQAIAEPFAGGAGASLTLLYFEETPEIFINDADPAIFNFWWSVLFRQQLFAEKLMKTRISMAEWRRQREVHKSRNNVSRISNGFATFYLNRCNRSGIIMKGGPIGGAKQRGKWKLGARFNRSELQRRCQKIADHRDRIHVSCLDGIDFILSLDPETTCFFIDPPYFEKGQTLYLNALDEQYHHHLASLLESMKDVPWIMTYDDCPAIRRMYRDWANVRPFLLQYSAAKKRKGNELLITPKWMNLPSYQKSDSLYW